MKEKIFTWRELNERLLLLRTHAAVLELFHEQKRNGASARWLTRIWHRYSKLRGRAERNALNGNGKRRAL